ncbi:MAG: hypothetical protein IAF58_05670 [Leptolyngbya sp.]|nr:hypothetical protein [Candidatus Melainabacteria bacterium]
MAISSHLLPADAKNFEVIEFPDISFNPSGLQSKKLQLTSIEEIDEFSKWTSLISKRKNAEAMKLVKESLVKHPDWCAGYYFLGKHAEAELDDDIALEMYSKALNNRPNCLSALEARGFQYDARNENSKAIRDFQQTYFLTSGQNKQRMRIRLAKTYLKAKNYNLGQKFSRDAKVVEPKNAFVRLIEIDCCLKQKLWRQAINLCDDALIAKIPSARFYLQRAEAECGLSLFKDVIRDCDKYLNLKTQDTDFLPDQKLAHSIKGRALAALGRRQQAKLDSRQVIRSDAALFDDTIFLDTRKIYTKR